MIGPYQLIGGADTCQKLATAFYARVAKDPILRRLYAPNKSPTKVWNFKCPAEVLTTYFTQLFGGPCEYSKRRWSLSLYEAHARFRVGPKERDAWLKNIFAALDDLGIEEPARGALRQMFEDASAHLINQGPRPSSKPGGESPVERWEMQVMLDDAVAAVRRGDAQQAIRLADSRLAERCFVDDRGALLSLLAIMSGGGDPDLLVYVRQRLLANPGLAKERYTHDRSLLREVAANGCIPVVELLLQLGADPNAADEYGHTPLYVVGNACSAETGGDVVRLLVAGGADVNFRDQVKRCTGLHMAARRGNVRVAEALVDCGATWRRATFWATPLCAVRSIAPRRK